MFGLVMLVKSAVNKAIRNGMVTDVRERMIEITNPVNGQRCSAYLVKGGERTLKCWKVHGTKPDDAMYDNFYSTYVDNLTQALRMIS